MPAKKKELNCVLVHPELIIGGAERLMLDIALSLMQHNHKVTLYTAFHNKDNCFQETIDGTVSVKTRGNWIPKKIFGKLHALMSIIRMLYVSIALLFEVLFGKIKVDLIICDQIALAIPLLKLMRKPVLYYCHFPDRYLAAPSRNPLKRAYRWVLDGLESFSIGCADRIAVNSKFTLAQVQRAFPKVVQKKTPDILYPPVSTAATDAYLLQTQGQTRKQVATDLPDELRAFLDDPTTKKPAPPSPFGASSSRHFILLSINRFETKKNLLLAVRAFAMCGRLAPGFQQAGVLVLAGGYDENNADNVSCLNELREEAEKLGVSDHVIFMTSFSNKQKQQLLRIADCLIYTPSNEHFGIVPVEAMSFGVPVIAANTGGPTESVVNRETGLLCEASVEEFTGAISRLLLMASDDGAELREMGEKGKQRVHTLFSLEHFGADVNNLVLSMVEDRKKAKNS